MLCVAINSRVYPISCERSEADSSRKARPADIKEAYTLGVIGVVIASMGAFDSSADICRRLVLFLITVRKK